MKLYVVGMRLSGEPEGLKEIPRACLQSVARIAELLLTAQERMFTKGK